MASGEKLPDASVAVEGIRTSRMELIIETLGP